MSKAKVKAFMATLATAMLAQIVLNILRNRVRVVNNILTSLGA